MNHCVALRLHLGRAAQLRQPQRSRESQLQEPDRLAVLPASSGVPGPACHSHREPRAEQERPLVLDSLGA